MKGVFKSKTMWFNAAIAILGVLELQQATVKQFVGEANFGAVMLVIAAVGAFLRVVTTSALSDK